MLFNLGYAYPQGYAKASYEICEIKKDYFMIHYKSKEVKLYPE